jgi:hypothetical protein
MKYPSLMIALFSIFCYVAKAQTGSISGKLQDASDGKPLPFATISLFKAKDTSLVTYRLSNPTGEFKVPGLPLLTELRMVITFSGYEVVRKSFQLTPSLPDLVLDTIRLKPSSQQLDEVIVIAEKPPVVIKNDTIEFNASAFKTLPNALVEDLLRKLPGVMVDAAGNIRVNGKIVNRIMVDGKNFFGSDPRMASRNLPANIIDKIQVVDDKEELQRNGDDNLNNVGKMVNITLKKGVKKGWFGKAYAGQGNQGLYETGMIANIFRDTLQLSLLGYANNLNRPGFSLDELMQTGGIARSNDNMASRTISAWSRGSGGVGMAINGVNFGGMRSGGGVAESKGIGINLNHAPNKGRSIYGQYFFGNIIVNKQDITETKQFNEDTIVQQQSNTDSRFLTNAHRIGLGGKFNPDSLTTIYLNMSYMAGFDKELTMRDLFNTHNIFGALSSSSMQLDNRMNTYGYEHVLSFARASATKRNRRFSIYHSLSVNNKFNDWQTLAQTRFLYPALYDSALRQLRNEKMPNTDVIVSLNYSEPLGKGFTFRIGGRYDHNKQGGDVQTFIPKGTTQRFDSLDQSYTSLYNRRSHRALGSLGLEYKWNKLVITPALRVQYQSIYHLQQQALRPVSQQLLNVLPALSLQYKQLTMSYSKDVQLPSPVYLIPVINNSNPYFINAGNANLLPAQRQQLSANFFFNDPARHVNFYANGYASFINNDVVQQVSLNDKGIQTSAPVNADGTRNLSVDFEVNKQYKNNQKRIITWRTGASYQFNRSRLLFNGQSGWQKSLNMSHWIGLDLNFQDRFEWNNSYGIDHSLINYSNDFFPKLSYVYHGATTELILRYPKHMIWETKLNYVYNGSIPTGLPRDVLRWSAAINLTMLKDERGVLKLSVNDILNRNADIAMSLNRNMIRTSNINVLGQYFLLTFTYNIRSFGSNKQKVGGESLFRF